MPKNNLSKIMTMVQNSTFLILPSLGIDGQGVSFFAPQSTSEQSPLCSGIFLQKCHPLRSVPLPLLSKLEPLRSRWRLRRLTDAAYPLRVLRWVAVWFLVQT